MGRPIIFEEKRSGSRNSLTTVQLVLLFLIIGLVITAFGLSVDNFTLLNATDGTIDLGNKDIRTTGTVFANITEIGGQTIRITDTGIEQLNPNLDGVEIKGPDGGTTVTLDSTTAPAETANKLYSVGGDLFWSGTEIGTGSGGSFTNFKIRGNAAGTCTIRNDETVRITGGTNINVVLSETESSTLTVNYTGPGAGGGTCYGVSTDGGLSLSGTSFSVVAGDGITVGAGGVSVNLADNRNLEFYGTSIGLSTVLTGVSYQGNVIDVEYGGIGLSTTGGVSRILLSTGNTTYDNVTLFSENNNLAIRYTGTSVVFNVSDQGGGGGTCYGVSTGGGLSLSGTSFSVVAGDGITVGAGGVSVNLADNRNLEFYGTSIGLSTVLTGVSYQGNVIDVEYGGIGLSTTGGVSRILLSTGNTTYDNVTLFSENNNLAIRYTGTSVVFNVSDQGGGGGTCYGVSTGGGLSLSGTSFSVVAGDGITVGAGGVSVNLADNRNLEFYGTSIGLSTVLTGVSYQGNVIDVEYGGIGLSTTGGVSRILLSTGNTTYDNVTLFSENNNLAIRYTGTSVVFNVSDQGGGGGTCYGVSTGGGLSLSGTSFSVVAGDGITVGAGGVSVNLADNRNLEFYGTSIGLSTVLTGVSYQGNVIDVEYGGIGLSTTGGVSRILLSTGNTTYDNVTLFSENNNLAIRYTGTSVVFNVSDQGGGGGTCYGVSTGGGLSLSGTSFSVVAGDGITVGAGGVSVNLADNRNLEFYGTSIGLSTVLTGVSYQGNVIDVEYGGIGLSTTGGVSRILLSTGNTTYDNVTLFSENNNLAIRYTGTSIVFNVSDQGGGGGTCYGVSTDGGMVLVDGNSFAVVAGNNITVSANGVSLASNITSLSGITMNLGTEINFGTSNNISITNSGTSFQIKSNGVTFKFPGADGDEDQFLKTDGVGNLFFGPGRGGGGGTCYGVSTEGGLSLTSGLCFAVIAGDGIAVSSAGVCVLTGKGLSVTASGVSIDSSVVTLADTQTLTNKTLGTPDFTGLLTLNSGSSIMFTDGEGTDTIILQAPEEVIGPYSLTLPTNVGADGQFLRTNGDGVLTFDTAPGGGTCYGVSTEGGLSLNSGLCFAVIAGDGIAVSSAGVCVLTGKGLSVTASGVSIDSSVVTLADTQTLTNKTLGTPDFTGLLTLNSGSSIMFTDGEGTDTIILQAPQEVIGPYSLTLPTNVGADGQFLRTNGDGVLTFDTAPGGGTCYGVSTEGGLSLNSGLCFAVIAGDNIRVSANGVSLAVNISGMRRITMNNGAKIDEANQLTTDPRYSVGSIAIMGNINETGVAGGIFILSGQGSSDANTGDILIGRGDQDKIIIDDNSTIKIETDQSLVPKTHLRSLLGTTSLAFLEAHSDRFAVAGPSISVSRSGTSLALVSNGTVFNFPGGDGVSGQFLRTDGSGNLTFGTPTDTTYGVSTDGGLSLTNNGISFAVVAGDNIRVSANGVSLAEEINNIDKITMSTGGEIDVGGITEGLVKITSFVGGTSLQLVSNGVEFNFPGADGDPGQFLRTNGSGDLSFATATGGTCYGVSTEGGLSLTSGLCFAVIAGDGIAVSSAGVCVLTGKGLSVTASGVSIDSSVVTLADTQTLTNKTLGTPDFTGLLTLNSGSSIMFIDSGGIDTIILQAPEEIIGPYSLTLPTNDGVDGQFLRTNGNGVLTFDTVPGGGTCYGVSTEGGLSLTSGLCFAVIAGDGITVSSAGVCVLTGKGLSVTASGVSIDSSVVTLADTQTLTNKILTIPIIENRIVMATGASIVFSDAGVNNTILKSSTESAAEFTLTLPPDGGSANQFLQTNGAGVLTFATAPGGTCYSASTDGGLSLSGTSFSVVAGDGITVSSAGVSVSLATNKNLEFYGTCIGLSNILENVSYNGDFNITGDNVTVTSSDQSKPLLTLEHDGTGTTSGGILRFDQSNGSGSAGEIIGRIQFQGKDQGAGTTNYGDIETEIQNPVDGSIRSTVTIRSNVNDENKEMIVVGSENYNDISRVIGVKQYKNISIIPDGGVSINSGPLSQPAGSILLNLGYFPTENISLVGGGGGGGGGGSSDIRLRIGTTSGGQELALANDNLLSSSVPAGDTALTAGDGRSLIPQQLNLPSGGTSTVVLGDNKLYYSDAESEPREIHFGVSSNQQGFDTTGTNPRIMFFIEYMHVSNF